MELNTNQYNLSEDVRKNAPDFVLFNALNGNALLQILHQAFLVFLTPHVQLLHLLPNDFSKSDVTVNQ